MCPNITCHVIDINLKIHVSVNKKHFTKLLISLQPFPENGYTLKRGYPSGCYCNHCQQPHVPVSQCDPSTPVCIACYLSHKHSTRLSMSPLYYKT